MNPVQLEYDKQIEKYKEFERVSVRNVTKRRFYVMLHVCGCTDVTSLGHWYSVKSETS